VRPKTGRAELKLPSARSFWNDGLFEVASAGGLTFRHLENELNLLLLIVFTTDQVGLGGARKAGIIENGFPRSIAHTRGNCVRSAVPAERRMGRQIPETGFSVRLRGGGGHSRREAGGHLIAEAVEKLTLESGGVFEDGCVWAQALAGGVRSEAFAGCVWRAGVKDLSIRLSMRSLPPEGADEPSTGLSSKKDAGRNR